jgi:hypothetical protein
MKTIKTVSAIPNDFTLVQDSQDKESVAQYFPGIEIDSYGCLFVKVEDGEYKEIYGCESYVPYNNKPVDRLI